MPKNPFSIVALVIGLSLGWDVYNIIIFLMGPYAGIFFSVGMIFHAIPTIAGVAGLIVFVHSKFESDALLKAYMCFNIIILPFWLMNIMYMFGRSNGFDSRMVDTTMFLINMGVYVFRVIFCMIGLWQMRLLSKPLLKEVRRGESHFLEFSPVIKGRRFLNRLIDVIIIFALLYQFITESFFIRKYFRGTGYGTLALIEFAFTFYFYLILEAVFNTSIGKAFTKTMVVDETGNKPSFLTMLGRTLCRFIPFEPLSFLGKNPRGWHDTISGTWVVAKK